MTIKPASLSAKRNMTSSNTADRSIRQNYPWYPQAMFIGVLAYPFQQGNLDYFKFILISKTNKWYNRNITLVIGIYLFI